MNHTAKIISRHATNESVIAYNYRSVIFNNVCENDELYEPLANKSL